MRCYDAKKEETPRVCAGPLLAQSLQQDLVLRGRGEGAGPISHQQPNKACARRPVTTIFAARRAKASSICKFKASPVYNTLSCGGSSCWSTRVAKNEDSPAKLAILQEWDFWAK